MQLRNRDEIESAFAARLSRLNSDFRHRLQDLIGPQHDFNKVPDSFWFEAEAEMKRDLAIAMLLVFSASAAQHGMGKNLTELTGLRYSSDQAPTAAREFIATSRKRFDEIRTRVIVPVELKTATPGGVPAMPSQPAVYSPDELEKELQKVFGPSRAESVAATEVTKAQTAGGEAGVAANLGLEEMDLWFTRRDDKVCPICGPLDRLPRSRWTIEYASGPPAHPQCRCWIEYANERVSA